MSDSECNLVRGLAGDLLKITASAEQLSTLYETLGEFNHLVRNRLNSLKLSIYLARQDGPKHLDEYWAELDRRYRTIEGFVERLQTIYRPMSLTPMRLTVGMLFDDLHAKWSKGFESRQVRFMLTSPSDQAVGHFDPIRLGQGLDALAAWRTDNAKANSLVHVEWHVAGEDVVVLWREPEVTCLPLDDAPEGDAPCLALPLLARIITAHGGRLDASLEDGLLLQLRWPLGACAA
ncbi:MAG: hypothetical protein ABI353_14875 [Isosphaeraceae bacterium]